MRLYTSCLKVRGVLQIYYLTLRAAEYPFAKGAANPCI
jgi:hypothetical protein